MDKHPPYILSVAPLMNYSDRHFRMFLRLLTKKTWLYTEMISTGAILHGDVDRHLKFSTQEHPIILQLGGNNIQDLTQCVKIATPYNYDEINLNAGCPSDKVHHGGFGATLMANATATAKIIEAMCNESQKSSMPTPITIKCRIGIDGSKINFPVLTDYKNLYNFVKLMKNAGAKRVIIHARIAILGGLSPKENRKIPPLQYNLVHTLCDEIKQIDNKMFIEINGGIKTLTEASTHLQYADAVMIGRAAINTPYIFADADTWISQKISGKTSGKLSGKINTSQNTNADYNKAHKNATHIQHRHTIARSFSHYLQTNIDQLPPHAQNQKIINTHIHALKHLIHLYTGIPNVHKWRQVLTHHIVKKTDPVSAVEHALAVF